MVQILLNPIPAIQNQWHYAFIECKQENRSVNPWNPYYRTSAMIPLIAMHLLHQVKEHPHMSNFGELN